MFHPVKTLCIISVFVAMSVSASAFAQSGVSSMSMSASRAGVNMKYGDIRVEEYVNYHRHALPMPSFDERVHLDTRWETLPSGKIVLQVGLSTQRDIDPEYMTPLNLVLVVDCSGSMQGDRIAKLKKSLLSFTERLRPVDTVSIVSFDDEAHVVLPGCHNTDSNRISKAISALVASGSTNLHDGLMLGYQQAQLHFDKQLANRVILLTDGLANVGTTNSKTIAANSKQWNKRGIDLSTIGLGNSFNQTLLRELADAGRGAIHFVNDAEDIQKSFVDELDSLLSPAADNVKIIIDCQRANEIARIYGYTPVESDSGYRFRMEDMSHGATQIIVSEFKKQRSDLPVHISLSYTDRLTGKPLTTSETVVLRSQTAGPRIQDACLRKNHSIARVAFSIKQAAKLMGNNKYGKAAGKLAKAIHFAGDNFSFGDDEDVDRVVTIAESCLENARQFTNEK